MNETDKSSLQYKADVAFTHFRIWCHINEVQDNETNFKVYIKTLKNDLNFWVKKKIAESYFGYEYTYSNETNKWTAKKENNYERKKDLN